MSRIVILLPEALNDATEAYAWYEERSVGLGGRFLDRVDECIDWISKHPDLFAFAYKKYRRAIVRRFPYVIYYKHDDEVVTVYSIFHSAQNPAKWRRRLKSQE